MKRQELIIIGPCASGKSTIALELAKRLKLNCFQVDLLRWYYFYKNGYNLPKALAILEKSHIYELNELWQPFQLLTIENVLTDFKNGIFDFGGTYTLTQNNNDFLRIKKAFNDFSNIVLVLPSKSKEKSLEVINERVKAQLVKYSLSEKQIPERLELNRRMVYDDTNYLLATHTFYFENKTKEELADEILEIVFDKEKIKI